MRRGRPRSLAVAVALGAAVALTALLPAASAAPPPNDAFAFAQPLAGESGSVAGTNVDATKERGEPDHADDTGGRSVWYRWTAPSSGPYVFDTCGTGFDTLLAVYTGTSVSALTEVVSNDDSCADQSMVFFSAAAGTAYSIVVDAFDEDPPATGPFTLRWQALRPPANDNVAAAQALTGASGTIESSNLGATPEPGERSVAGSVGQSVWFSWVATFNGTATFETCGSSFDTVLAAYTGTTISSLSLVASNDDRCGLGSRIRFLARAGTEYRIAVDGTGERASGLIRLAWSLAARPANDVSTNARRIVGRRGALRGSNQGALRQPGELRHAGFPPSASVWFRWRAPSTMGIRFQTCTATFDSVLDVYRGRVPRTATRVDEDDDSCPRGTGSRVDFLAKRGVEYLIAVDGVFDATGTFVLTWGPPGASASPCRVPDVRGDTLARATRVLEQADCRVGRITYSRSGLVPRGRVISQLPLPGRRLRFLARVSLEISR